jgi:FkbM family methyltransferase
MEIIRNYLPENSLCFDIGANIGRKSEELVKMGARVICVEPQADCLNSLFSKFGSNSNVVIIQKAVGSSRGMGKLFKASENTISSMSTDFISTVKNGRFSGYTWESTPVECEIVTMDDLINEFGIPDFCKIDVEGYESEILNGLSKSIPLISIEFTPELKKNSFDCIKRMESLGQYEYNYSSQECGKFSFDWISSEEIIEFLNTINSTREFGDIYIRKK